jgi:hypothetical protein
MPLGCSVVCSSQVCAYAGHPENTSQEARHLQLQQPALKEPHPTNWVPHPKACPPHGFGPAHGVGCGSVTHCPFPSQINPFWQDGQYNVPPQPSSHVPHCLPCCAHVCMVHPVNWQAALQVFSGGMLFWHLESAPQAVSQYQVSKHVESQLFFIASAVPPPQNHVPGA